jgi:hypothetical protein
MEQEKMGIFASWFGSGGSKKSTINGEINVMEAINAHVRWKIRLEKYVDGTSEEKLDPNVICRDDQCQLGRWINGAALEHFHDDAGLVTLRDDHAQFHIIAGEVVAKMQANDKVAAEYILKGEYMEASRKVVRDLTELNKHLTS